VNIIQKKQELNQIKNLPKFIDKVSLENFPNADLIDEE